MAIVGSHLDLPLKLFKSNSSKLLYRNALSSLLILHSIKTLKTFFTFFILCKSASYDTSINYF